LGTEEIYIGFWLESWRERGPLERPRRRWEDNISIDIQEVGYGGMKLIDLFQDRDRRRELLNVVMNHRVQYNAWNFLIS
jgi:hypothetical protein